MIIQESGEIIIGFSGVMRCTHCTRTTNMQVRQEYFKQSFIFISFGAAYHPATLFCSVCEKKLQIDDSKGLFLSKDYERKVIEILDGGKELTRAWFSKLDSKEREQVLKRLNHLKAYTIVSYIAG